MNAKTNKPIDKKNLRALFTNMSGEKYQAIRDAYYKAIEGLHTLASELEIADLEFNVEGSPTALLDEHYIACEALGVMRRSRLGKVL